VAELTPEVEPRTERAKLAPLDFEERATDLAIEALADVKECDQAHVCVKWLPVGGKTVPVLYVYFASLTGDNTMPRVHVDALGELRPAHAVCLATMPSRTIIESASKIRDLVRGGVEAFLLQYNVRKPRGADDKMTISRKKE
jgi:hypothetical protein